MSTDTNKTIVRRFAEECWGQGDFSALEELIADDIVRNGQPVGREGMKGVIMMVRSALPDLSATIEDLIAEGDKVVWRYTSQGTHQGPPFGVPPTGKRLTWTGTGTIQVANGRIADIWDNVDMLAIMQQLGAVSMPGTGATG